MLIRPIVFWMACFLCSGCGSSPSALYAKGAEQMIVHVIDHGLHTGIVVDARTAADSVSGLAFDLNEIGFIEFGWGDRAFYQAESFSLWLAIKALFFPTESVMHVAGLRHHPEHYFRRSDIERILLSKSQLVAMLGFINQSFVRDGQGDLINLGRGLYAYSRFYSATSSYHIFNNCNTWTMEALSEADVATDSPLALTARGVMRRVRRHQKKLISGQAEF
ncbi:MAG: DUF2459 domain-containing protein [Gammaproteobacteria bacterium]|nr:DUF2459 domain-containing protein [Gammaproteobacteria bacterium]